MIRSLFHPTSVNPRCLPPQRVMVSLFTYQSRNPAALNQVSSCSRWRGTMVVQTASGAMHIKDPEDGPKTVQDTFNAGDLDGLVGLYETEAVVVLGPGQVASGSGAIREMFSGLLATGGRLELKYGKNSLHQVGDLALRTLEWTLKSNDPDGDSVTMGGLAAVVLRRQPDGYWRLVIDNACPFGETLA